jgi:multiple sugar transport system permease protein
MSLALEKPTNRYLSLAPTTFFLVALTMLPIANLVWSSFFHFDWVSGTQTRRFVGLANYAELGSDPLVGASIVNTLIFVAVGTTLQVGLGLALALLCSRIGRRSRIYRTLFLLPILIPGIIIGAIWRLMYNFQFGIINQLLGMAGIAPLDWLGSPNLALLSVIVVDIWHWTPFSFLLLLAAVENLPGEVSEAAKVDGASHWQEFWAITLPLLKPAIFVTFVFRAMIAFKVFDEVYLLTGGGPGTATEVLSFTIYQRFFAQDDVGYGSAMSVAVIAVIALLLSIGLTRQWKGAAR